VSLKSRFSRAPVLTECLNERRQLHKKLAVDPSEFVDGSLQLADDLRRETRGLSRLLGQPLGLLFGSGNDASPLGLCLGDELSGPFLGIAHCLADVVLGADEELADLQLILALLPGQNEQRPQAVENVVQTLHRPSRFADRRVDGFDRVRIGFARRWGDVSGQGPIGKDRHFWASGESSGNLGRPTQSCAIKCD
jgi:hypothetical protein